MTLSLNDVSAVLAEVAPVCVGGFIQKIQQCTPHAISISLRRPQRSVAILLSAHAQHGRLHILHKKISGAPTPPSFCQYLRAHLMGAKVCRIVQTPHDRIVWLELKKHDTISFLVAALTGRSANLFVLDAQATVLRSLKPEQSSGRVAGQSFALSPVPLVVDTRESTREFSSRLHVADETDFPVSQRIEETHLAAEQDEHREDARRQHATCVRKHIKKLQRQIERLTGDLDKVLPYHAHKRYGELLKSHLSALTKKQDHVVVVDYFDETLPTLTLPLDHTKNGPENLADYFKKYRKYIGAQTHLVPRLQETQQTLADLQRTLCELESGKMPAPTEYKTRPRTDVSPNVPRRVIPKTATAYRSFCSQDGHAILVGKNAGDNDVLTFTVSGPDDLWLHANGASGSHVIVKLQKKQDIQPETLKDAATLAVFYSNLRKSGKGEILYALKKHVKKPKGAQPGSVTVTRGKTMWVSVSQARLERLKGSGCAA